MITNRHKSLIRSLEQLKFRKSTGLFIAEGEKVVKELMDSEIKVKYIFGIDSFLMNAKIVSDDERIIEVKQAELERISFLQSPNEVLAVAEIPGDNSFSLDKAGKLILLLDSIRDPGNMGTIIRTADWFGVKQLICSRDCVDCWNPKVVQSAMGSLFRMNVSYVPLPEFCKVQLGKSVFKIVGASLDGDDDFIVETKVPTALVIGSESHGISSDLIALLNAKIRIAQHPSSKAESLNASVATGILLEKFFSAYKK